MPATQPSMDLRPLCYEHHLEMKLNRNLLNSENGETQTTAYRCTDPDCLVHYDTSRGYFLLSQNGDRDKTEALPDVRCFKDGAPMYLAEISPAIRSFRLWTCPQCGAGRTNEESLSGLPAQRIGDLDRGNAADSKPIDTAQT
jgi:hypothetical protein